MYFRNVRLAWSQKFSIPLRWFSGLLTFLNDSHEIFEWDHIQDVMTWKHPNLRRYGGPRGSEWGGRSAR